MWRAPGDPWLPFGGKKPPAPVDSGNLLRDRILGRLRIHVRERAAVDNNRYVGRVSGRGNLHVGDMRILILAPLAVSSEYHCVVIAWTQSRGARVQANGRRQIRHGKRAAARS